MKWLLTIPLFVTAVLAAPAPINPGQREQQLADLGDAGGEIYAIAREMASDTGRFLWHFPSFENITKSFGGIRMKAGFIDHMKKLEMTNFGARLITPKTSRGHIFFLDSYPKDGEMYVYHIATPWKLSYPRKLERKLLRAGFSILDWSSGVGADVWDPLFTIKKAGVKRGDVELNWPESGGAPIQKEKPWVLQDWQDIQTILEDTYPTLEIMMTIIGSLIAGALVGIVAWCCYRSACKRFGWNDRTQDYWAWRRKWLKETGGLSKAETNVGQHALKAQQS